MLTQTTAWLLAAVDPTGKLDELDARARSSFRLDGTDTIIVLGAATVLVGLIFFWAFFLRKRPNHKDGVPSLTAATANRHRHRRRSSSRNAAIHASDVANAPASGVSADSPSRPPRSRRRSSHSSSSNAEPPPQQTRKRVRVRKRRHPSEEYPRNPTLGETGGLPPLRPEEPERESQEPTGKPTE